MCPTCNFNAELLSSYYCVMRFEYFAYLRGKTGYHPYILRHYQIEGKEFLGL